jgi:hypothetical protein
MNDVASWNDNRDGSSHNCHLRKAVEEFVLTVEELKSELSLEKSIGQSCLLRRAVVRVVC